MPRFYIFIINKHDAENAIPHPKMTIMGNLKKELTKMGVTDNVLRSRMLEFAKQQGKHLTDGQILPLLQDFIEHPAKYKRHPHPKWRALAEFIQPKEIDTQYYELRDKPLPYAVFGRNLIDQHSYRQMDMAMRLPIAVRGALMPDAHAGYGLPVGGVLATQGVVLPYAVGLDIGCRMSLTILNASADHIRNHRGDIEKALWNNTAFGMEGVLPFKQYHPLFDREEWRTIPILKKMRDKAVRQLGTSGSGNHFVDICEVRIAAGNPLYVDAGNYTAILSHSGSRGLGAAIADYFTAIAKAQCRLPREAGPFAWLDLDSEAGEMYWRCMEIAGEYSAINHELIHHNVAQGMRLQPLANVSNHHNFAWKETLADGSEVIVHRKGATPAHAGELGIIPANMTDTGLFVTGLGCEEALCSASHGAGRAMSRQDARNSFSRYALNRQLAQRGIRLLGGSTEEAPDAYKSIDKVLAASKQLVNVVGRIYPRIVRMNQE